MALATTWAVLATTPSAEASVAKELADRHIAHRLIQRRATRAKRGRVIEVLAPAWPRYILIDRTATHIPSEIEDVIDFVRCGEDIGHVTTADLAELQERIDNYDILLPRKEPCAFQPGERVIVRGMSLAAGYHGIFQRSLEDGLCVIEQEWLGRLTPVTVRIEDLDKSPKKRKFRARRKRKRR